MTLLLSDRLERFARGLYVKQNGRERELDSRETERERVRGRAFSNGYSSISSKLNILA